MSTLYKLNDDFMKIINEFNEDDADIEDLLKKLDQVKLSLEEKVENYAKVIADKQGNVDALKAEEKRLREKRQTQENNIKRMKEQIENTLLMQGQKKLKTDLFSFNIQNNPPSLSIENDKFIPKHFYREQPPKLDRKALLDYVKENDLEGVSVKQTESLRIR